jgi:hypothetical protein
MLVFQYTNGIPREIDRRERHYPTQANERLEWGTQWLHKQQASCRKLGMQSK